MKSMEEVVVTKSQWYVGREVEKWLLVFTDVFALMLAFYLANIFATNSGHRAISFDATWSWGRLETAYLTQIWLAFGTFWIKGHYSKRRPYWSEIRDLVNVALVLALINAALILLSKSPFSRVALMLNWILAPCFLLLARSAVKRMLIACGGWIRPMVIVGLGESLVETARAFDDEPLMGYQLVAFLIPDGKPKPALTYKDRNNILVPFLPLGKKPQQILEHLGNPHVVLALEQGGLMKYQELIQRLSHLCQEVQIVPSLRGLPLYGMEVSHFFSHEVLLLTVRNNLVRRGPQLIKRCFDIFASACGLIVASPLLLWIAIKVSATKGPIFYGHKRVGQNGKTFLCYKFRTMQPNADNLLRELLERDPEAKAEWDRDFKLKNDPRITPIGHFLRKSSLDELPQLWNVLKGEMSLVGPRPIVDAELERYGDQVDHYLKVKPGITGLWQISGRNDTTYDTRVYLDSWYVKNWSFFNDIVILLRTIEVILNRDGAY